MHEDFLTLSPMGYQILWLPLGASQAPLNIKEGVILDPMLIKTKTGTIRAYIQEVKSISKKN